VSANVLTAQSSVDKIIAAAPLYSSAGGLK
jgi:hypothetical protein